MREGDEGGRGGREGSGKGGREEGEGKEGRGEGTPNTCLAAVYNWPRLTAVNGQSYFPAIETPPTHFSYRNHTPRDYDTADDNYD